ncbi:MAG: hypothetical protein FWE43_03245 [Streptococcaceae bacterium]|nr:hypothetical protein [Streptococcaceae bacterium]MCL2681479.1 hypothetical protein [Streptococcaceae bacterium]
MVNVNDDVMNAIIVHTSDGYAWTQLTISDNDIRAINLIQSNHNFAILIHNKKLKLFSIFLF